MSRDDVARTRDDCYPKMDGHELKESAIGREDGSRRAAEKAKHATVARKRREMRGQERVSEMTELKTRDVPQSAQPQGHFVMILLARRVQIWLKWLRWLN